MALLVQKFGGTSVADAKARLCLAAKVCEARARGDEVVLVVSAMGRRGSPYATDTLLDLIGEYESRPDPLASDLLVSCGETISACLVSALLRSQGVPSVPMTAYSAGIRADGPHGDATPTGVDASAIRDQLAAGAVPVITGFQAIGASGELVTLGRGGSDTSAVAVGAALGAEYVDIYTDVPGVAKADPRVVPDAPFVEFLDYDSMFRLAKHGARVLHDKSAIIAQRGNILIRVRSTFDDGLGTLIGPAARPDSGGPGVPDFIGLASVKEEDGLARVNVIFAKGRGTPGAGAVAEVAAALGAALCPRDDPDALSFICNQAYSGDLSRAIFATLNSDRS